MSGDESSDDIPHSPLVTVDVAAGEQEAASADEEAPPSTDQDAVAADPTQEEEEESPSTSSVNWEPRTNNRDDQQQQGNNNDEQISGSSALGVLTRKFVDMLWASESRSFDINDASELLQTPKRRIYDIANALEGVGLVEKRSKNMVAWKGSEGISSLLDANTMETQMNLRDQISSLSREEDLLDHWIARFQKIAPRKKPPIYTADIIDAILYHDDTIVPNKEEVVNESGKPLQTFLAIHSPHNAVAHISKKPHVAEDGVEVRKLYVGTATSDGLQTIHPTDATTTGDEESNDNDDSKAEQSSTTSNNKRRRTNEVNNTASTDDGESPPREDDDKLQVFLLPVTYNEKRHKIESLGCQPLSSVKPAAAPQPPSSSSSTWEFDDTLAQDEGVADFFVGPPADGNESA